MATPAGLPTAMRVGSALTVLLAVTAVGGCSRLLDPPRLSPSDPPSVPTAASQPPPAAAATTPTVVRGACIDPSGSTGAAFSNQLVADLAANLRRWVPETDPVAGWPDGPGLTLTLRVIGTASYSSDAESILVEVPPFSALPARPDLTADGVLDPGGPYDRWRARERRASDQRRRAAAAADAAAERVAALVLDHTAGSGITGCLSALAQTLPDGRDRAVLLASDLADNRPHELAGDLAGAPVLVVQPCPSGEADRCSALARTADDVLAALNAGPRTVIRPEVAGSALEVWMAPR